MVKEPSEIDVNKHWMASLPHISNTLDEILIELKKLNKNNNKEMI
jgi:hypothetical protein